VIKDISRKKLYLDVCTLCRPFDDQNIMRIRLETDAFYLILQNIQNKLYEMVVSPVHFKEIETIEELRERLWLLDLLDKYGIKPPCDLSKIRKRAGQLCNLKFGIADAAHVAFAEATSDLFITCDDKLLRKCNKSNVKISVVSPVDFCFKEDLR
jgi:predicted nucleic acid-binding protein